MDYGPWSKSFVNLLSLMTTAKKKFGGKIILSSTLGS